VTEHAAAVFLVGLLAGVHCVAMCGGIVSALSLRLDRPVMAEATGAGVLAAPAMLSQLGLHVAYSTGRIASYVVAGMVAGGVGGTVGLLSAVLPVQLVLAVIANALLVLLGLYLAGVGTIVSKLETLGSGWWRAIAPLARRLGPPNTPGRALVVGTIWGWLPCGLVYSVLGTALVSGSAARGAVVMLAFGLGTLPNLLAAGLAVERLRRLLGRPRVRFAAGLAVVALGIAGAIRTPGLVEQVKQGLACLT